MKRSIISAIAALCLLTSCGNSSDGTWLVQKTETTTVTTTVTELRTELIPQQTAAPQWTEETAKLLSMEVISTEISASEELRVSIEKDIAEKQRQDYLSEASEYYAVDKDEAYCAETDYTEYYLSLRENSTADEAHTLTFTHFKGLHEEALRAEKERLEKEEAQRKAEEARKAEEKKRQEEAKAQSKKTEPVQTQPISSNFNPIVSENAAQVLYETISPVLTKSGLTVTPTLTVPTVTYTSMGADTRAITLRWAHDGDGDYTSYVIYRTDASGNDWTKLTTLSAIQSDAVYTYTDNISSMQSRYFRYALVGVNGNTCGAPVFVQGWAKIRICIDPGHYLGCNSNGTYAEGTQMLLLGMKLKSSLESFGSNGVSFADARITRTGSATAETFSSGVTSELTISDKNTALRTRGVYAKSCDFFVSLHTNALSNWNETNMWGVYSFLNLTALGNSSDKQLAFSLGQTASQAITPGGVSVDSRSRFTSSNVIDKRSDGMTHYKVLRGADSVGVPGILLEHSFHTNPAVRTWLMNDANLNTLARAEAVTILRHYGFPVV